jgi:hypothetical protein
MTTTRGLNSSINTRHDSSLPLTIRLPPITSQSKYNLPNTKRKTELGYEPLPIAMPLPHITPQPNYKRPIKFKKY